MLDIFFALPMHFHMIFALFEFVVSAAEFFFGIQAIKKIKIPCTMGSICPTFRKGWKVKVSVGILLSKVNAKV